jgi:hypothetical protein
MNSTEEIPQDAVHGLLAGAFDATGADLPAVDLVPHAVSGFEKHRRRTRVLGGVASVAVLGIAAAAYATVPNGGSSTGGAPGSKPGKTPGADKTTSAAAPVYDIFAHPGTPDSLCKGNWMDTGVTQAQARQNCLLILPLLQSLLPGDTVVPTHVADINKDQAFTKAGLPALLKSSEVGVPHPAIAAEWSRVLSDPTGEYNIADSGEYSIKTADGATFGVGIGYSPKGSMQDPNSVCKDGKSAGSGVPCWSITLADGTGATFVTYPISGSFEAYVATSTGGQLTFAQNNEVGRYVLNGTDGRHYFDFATGTLHDGAVPGKFTSEQFSRLLKSQGFAELTRQYLTHSVGTYPPAP